MARQDPLRNFRFRVEIDGLPSAAFSEATIGATTTDVIEYREGSDPPHARKLSGLTKFGNVTLKRGVTKSQDLSDWHKQAMTQGSSASRRRVVVAVQDESGQDMTLFVISEAWPVKYEVSDLNAKGGDVLIELLELTNEGIERLQ